MTRMHKNSSHEKLFRRYSVNCSINLKQKLTILLPLKQNLFKIKFNALKSNAENYSPLIYRFI